MQPLASDGLGAGANCRVFSGTTMDPLPLSVSGDLADDFLILSTLPALAICHISSFVLGVPFCPSGKVNTGDFNTGI